MSGVIYYMLKTTCKKGKLGCKIVNFGLNKKTNPLLQRLFYAD